MAFWRYFAVKLLGTVWDTKGLYEQNRVLIINTKVLCLYVKKLFRTSGLELRVSGHGCFRRFC